MIDDDIREEKAGEMIEILRSKYYLHLTIDEYKEMIPAIMDEIDAQLSSI